MRRSRRALSALALGSAAASAVLVAAAPASAQDPIAPGTPCTTAAQACVDLATQQGWLLDGGAVSFGPVPVRSGKPGYETPAGVFGVTYRDIDHRSSEYDNAPMPYSVFFTDQGHAFHEGSLESGSHGCVRLEHDAAERFYNELGAGDRVEIVSTAPQAEQQQRTVRLGPVGP